MGDAGAATTTGSATTAPPVTDSGADDSAGGSPIFDVLHTPDIPNPPSIECDPDGDVTLQGTVYAPNGSLPIGGALVYTATSRPLPIPDGVYCSECVVPPCDPDWTVTEPDGSFTLPSISGDDRYLIVRKGDFMRVSPVTFEPGNVDVDPALTSLPGEHDPDAGMYIPKIAIAIDSTWDSVWEAMAEMGLGEVGSDGDLVWGTEHFDFYGGSLSPTSLGTSDDLFADPETLAQYQVIMLPCQTDPGPTITPDLQDWVEAGGKLYVTDLSQTVLDNSFPQYQTFGFPNGFGTVYGTVVDEGLLAWLEALPDELKDINPINPGADFATLNDLPEIRLDAIYAWTIDETPEVLVDDGFGNEVNVGHKTFLTADAGAGEFTSVVKGEFGCGRLMYATHHTTEYAHHGLEAMELVLVYLLLELTTCSESFEPPPH